LRDTINSAATKLAAYLQDPEDSVRVSALVTFTQFSQLGAAQYFIHMLRPTQISEAFRLAVTEAAPNILSALQGSGWLARQQVIKTLAKLAENGQWLSQGCLCFCHRLKKTNRRIQ
jgi:HEAT repeat protein